MDNFAHTSAGSLAFYRLTPDAKAGEALCLYAQYEPPRVSLVFSSRTETSRTNPGLFWS